MAMPSLSSYSNLKAAPEEIEAPLQAGTIGPAHLVEDPGDGRIVCDKQELVPGLCHHMFGKLTLALAVEIARFGHCVPEALEQIAGLLESNLIFGKGIVGTATFPPKSCRISFAMSHRDN
ncbi:hypothetical protein X737_22235 [Mesorhizobium sp. L48C026A00]|nr:hypothetical protein [Mesorhizobium sp. L48C026A00]ESZ15253.1 hypothetical protein X737_22235 [Mesorhizobium sp. L48C026A00]